MKQIHHKDYIAKLKLQNRIFWTIAFFSLVGAILYITKAPTINPCPHDCINASAKVVYAADEADELEQITAYIVEKFQPHGRQVAVRALACFISESGLRPDVIHVNTDGTTDAGIAQVNLYWHRETAERMTDWKLNIDKAERIYASRKNFSAWYGAYCK